MAFHVISGTYHVKGYSPDGDSIRFKANDEAHWGLLGGTKVKLNGQRHAQLRLEAIDTLETHYEDTHQPLELAQRATTALLELLGITDVVWNASRTKVTKAKDGVPGYIVARLAESNGRPVAFTFAGQPDVADGAPIFLDVARVARSVNAHMLSNGLAYPTYYKGLFSDLRGRLTDLAVAARGQSLGVWAHDRTTQGFDVTSLESVSTDAVILPKLFRRIAAYLINGGSIQGFRQELANHPEGVWVISQAHATHLDTLVEVAGKRVRMTEPPENLIFEG